MIEPPDVLSISIKLRRSKDPLKFELSKYRQLVRPSGNVGLGALGTVYVAGLTVEQAQKAIETALEPTHDVAEVIVAVEASNSKVCYLIEDHGAVQDVARAPVPYPLSAQNNVGWLLGNHLRRSAKLRAARIELHRPYLQATGCELVLPVAWDSAANAPTLESDYPLLPGDRVIVQASPSDVDAETADDGPPMTQPHGAPHPSPTQGDPAKSSAATVFLKWTGDDGSTRRSKPAWS